MHGLYVGNAENIAKTGGVGPNNVHSATSRRLYMGTVLLPQVPNVHLENLNPLSGFEHVGFIVGLPRDLHLRHSTVDGGPRLGIRFVPELAALRRAGGHTTFRNVPAGAELPAGRSFELLVAFEPAPSATEPYGIQFYDDINVTYDPTNRTVDGVPIELTPTSGVSLHLFVDAAFIEGVANEQVNLWFSTLAPGNRTRLFGSVPAARVDVWELEALF
jgi:hypothetical protein